MSTKIAKQVEIYAHRGGAGLMPENSLPAYKNAMAIGVDVLDMDVGLSKDGVVIVAHDFNLSPELTKLNGQWLERDDLLIKDLTYQELQRYDIGFMREGGPYAEAHPHRKNVPGTQMPSLRDVIEFSKTQAGGDRIRFQIEIKTRPNESDKTFAPEVIAQAVVDVLKAESVSARSEIHSFDWRALKNLPHLDSQVTPSYLTSSVWEGYDHYKILDFPALIHEMKSLGAKIWCPDRRDLFSDPHGREHVDLAHSLGLRVVVWTVNEVADMERLIEWGVNGLITDYPDRLKTLLGNRG